MSRIFFVILACRLDSDKAKYSTALSAAVIHRELTKSLINITFAHSTPPRHTHPSILFTAMYSGFLTPILLSLLSTPLLAHSGHGQAPLTTAPDEDWATHHLAEEHHISNFDAGAFFTLHDFDFSSSWTPDEIRRMYGLDDESQRGVDEAKKAEVVRRTLEIFDIDGDGAVQRGEWMEGWRAGKRLEDFGLGPGHHGDDEYEYEIHHFEKFHDESKSFPLLFSL